MLSQFMKEIDKDKGKGEIYILIRDTDQQVSKNFVNSLADETLIAPHFEIFVNLYHYLLAQDLLPLILYPRNLVLQHTEQPLAIIVDNIGNNELIRSSVWNNKLVNNKITWK